MNQSNMWRDGSVLFPAATSFRTLPNRFPIECSDRLNEGFILTDKLTERRQKILGIVVQEYTRTAQPISSKNIAENYQLGVSAATIRNDLATLEKEGLLTHPHTSAGRVPTDAGYRYYVQNLLSEDELPLAERRQIRSAFRTIDQEFDQWLRVSTTVLADVSQGAALATAPLATSSRFKHVEMVEIRDARVLLVLVLQTGSVKQQLLDLDQPMDQSNLSQISNELNDHLLNHTAVSIRDMVMVLSPFAQQIAHLIADLIERIDNQVNRQIYRDGLAQVLDAPEFVDSHNVRSIVQILEQRTLLDQVVDEYANDDIQVIIAGEGRFAELQAISLVISRYGVVDQATGILGVVGPIRMWYGRTIGAVRFVATLMSKMVEDIYGSQHPK
ncbi:heat-inducible transcriptional repressor HrcA [Chloroflexi bacterium TSY]|nr:heat-inducible transcriptional repressor HrcA [Chloroflexi bacterium TSY]